MNLKQIDAAIAAYESSLDDAGRARLAFFRGLWEELDSAARTAQHEAYCPPDEGLLLAGVRDGATVFGLAPVKIDGSDLARVLSAVSARMAESGGFDEPLASALSNVAWERVLAASPIDEAGSDPSAFIDALVAALEDEGMDDDSVYLSAIAALLALRALLDAPAQEAVRALRAAGAVEAHTLRCPVCGGEPSAARVGQTDATQGRGRELWCAQCGAAWSFDRVRCARCGTRNQAHLHYVSLEGDEAHRLALCDECGGYIRTVYQEDALAPFSWEVEDVVMAPLDAVAAREAENEQDISV